jgi:cyclic pyranopterin phosphate synthase
MTELTHLDNSGNLHMVNVGNKPLTARRAIALGSLVLGREIMAKLLDNNIPKGDAWASSRVAGIMAAKKTAELIPLTHPLKLDNVTIHLFPWGPERVGVLADVRATDRTGVEMEAMTAASVALLNMYDMTKALGKGTVIENIRLLYKTGGKSGDWIAPDVLSGAVEKLATSEGKGTPKQPADSAELRVNHGLAGDAHAGEWHRQVSLLGLESIKKMQAMGLKVDFGSFAENVATSGIELFSLPIGSLMVSARGVVMEVTQIGKECHSRCAVYHQAGDCVMPREGIFTKVLAGGTLQRGDWLFAIRVP